MKCMQDISYGGETLVQFRIILFNLDCCFAERFRFNFILLAILIDVYPACILRLTFFFKQDLLDHSLSMNVPHNALYQIAQIAPLNK